jgi:AmmeMemoRadiSam system protein A
MQEAEQRRLLAVVDRFVRARVRRERCEPDLPVAAEEEGGLFVTLRVCGELRGCIGTLESRGPIARTAIDMAASALRDPRFLDRPIREDELDDLEVELTLLDPPEPITGPEEIEIGRHGVVIEVGRRVGVFLPQVAVEYGWTAEETLDQCCRNKLQLPARSWRLPEARLFRIEGHKASTTDPGEGARD